jgi:large subunit ribosomal protein L13Ae
MFEVPYSNTKSKRLSHEVGWGYKDIVDRLEEKRKIKAQAFHQRKVGLCCLKSLT